MTQRVSTDIFYNIHQRHRDKYRGHSHEIIWSDDELKEFIAKRLALSPSAPKGVDADNFEKTWKEYFIDDKKIQVEHDWRYGFYSFEYILYHSLRRPRDFMLCFEQINILVKGELGVVQAGAKDVKNGVKGYCSVALDYLCEEYYSRAPRARDMLAIFHNEEKVMSVEFFEEHLVSKSGQIISGIDIINLLNSLYEMYAIGISYDKELTAVYWSKPPQDVTFAYEAPAMPIATGCRTIVFHPVVAEALNMYRGSRHAPKQSKKKDYA